MLRFPSTALAIALAAVIVSAQAGGPPIAVPAVPFAPAGPSAAGLPATGTGLIFGRVVDASSGKPIPGVTVAASSTTQTPSASAGAPPGIFRPQSVITGADGLFVFRDLPKGDFVLRGSLSGYLAVGSAGAGANAPSATLALAEGEKVNDVEVRLWKSGVVTGQALDELGDAVEGISITLLRIDTAGGRRNLGAQQSASTDDRGVYRFAGLLPGDYAVCALFSRHIAPVAAGVASASGNEDMQRTMSGSGGLSPSGSGYRVGDLMLISSSGQRNVDPAPGEDGRLSVFADACYPSAPVVQAAQAVHVDSGQERSQINLLMRIVPSARVFGTISGPANRVSGMAVHLYPASSDDSTMSNAIESAQTLTDPSGGFGFIGVPAGSYVLRVVYSPASNSGIPQEVINSILAQGGTVPPEILARARAASSTESTLWASAQINVGDTDVTGVSLALREGVRVSGAIVFEGTKDRPAADRVATASITFEAAEGSSSNSYPQPRGGFSADGTFGTSGVVPGRYLIRPFTPFPDWTLKSIVADGRDVSDDPIDVTSGDVSGVVITMTDRPTELSGTVRDATGAPDRRARVLVFPADRARWSRLGGGRRAGSTGVSSQGAFTMPGLLAGDYFVAAVRDPVAVNWQDPKVLDTLSRSASRVTLRNGERRTADLVTSAIR